MRNAESHTKSLRETTGLADAVWHVGGADRGLLGYENQRELMRAFFTNLKNSPDTIPTEVDPLSEAWGKGSRDWFDFSLLPEYNKVSKYFYFTVYAGSATTDGLAFKFFAPRPPQMEK